ncbi:methylenetetrahydrofolate reductase [Clostridium sp. WILCCON 0269]|uniref:Methylenetetrahydrofolate reductase n=1 Tax=Candidatus Clostridium eludens TaxID=3381663 RepID=A0ABW8SKT6_9CLOT
MFKEKILNKNTGILVYAITPPKLNNTPEKVLEVSQKQVERIKKLDIDGLIIYDIQDEVDRQSSERPFPFLQTIDPVIYDKKYLLDLHIPKIIYRCVGKYTEKELSEWMMNDLIEDKFSVFVGASSRKQKVKLKLSEAYNLKEKINTNVVLGGVVIPERHIKYGDEHIKIINKINNGCEFFVSQVIYNIEASKNFLSDYFYYCQDNNIEMSPIIFTISPCGSVKTLEFMKWLGIDIPKWLQNDLMHSQDILDKSTRLSKDIFEELFDFALEKGIPIGCNIESLSIRKVEIEASIQLAKDIKTIIDKKCR